MGDSVIYLHMMQRQFTSALQFSAISSTAAPASRREPCSMLCTLMSVMLSAVSYTLTSLT